MQRRVLLVVVFSLVLNVVLAMWLFASLLPASANAAVQDTPRHLTAEEYALLNQDGPLWLADVDFSGVLLRGANLVSANLIGANFSGANLTNSDLRWTTMYYANLSGADLTGVNLEQAHLEHADLSGANLSDSNLLAYLEGAKYNKYTKWPENFSPERNGMILVK